MAKTNFPPGWDEERVQKVLAHYETQSEDEALLRTKRPLRRPARRSWKCRAT
jgi:hypothetical protein